MLYLQLLANQIQAEPRDRLIITVFEIKTRTEKMAHLCQLFCLGQPLLDMQVTNGESLLNKYDLKADDGILAQDKHASMYVCTLLA